MICEHVELEMETTEPKDVAKAMLKFWLHQAVLAKRDYKAAESRVESQRRANQQAVEDWQNSDSLGFRPPLPFSIDEIQKHRDSLPKLKRNWEEAKAMSGYMVNFITERAHP